MPRPPIIGLAVHPPLAPEESRLEFHPLLLDFSSQAILLRRRHIRYLLTVETGPDRRAAWERQRQKRFILIQDCALWNTYRNTATPRLASR
jgi:hypothetical protein